MRFLFLGMKDLIIDVIEIVRTVANDGDLHGFNKITFYVIMAMLFIGVVLWYYTGLVVKKIRDFVNYITLTHIKD